MGRHHEQVRRRPAPTGRRRDRRRSDRGARARRRRPRRWVLVVLAVVAAGGLGAALAADALVVRDALEEAETAAGDARDLLEAGEVAAARDRLVDGRAELSRASRRTHRLLWRAAARVPGAGASFATLGGIVDVLDRGSEVGARIVGALEPLIGPDGEIRVQPEDGQLPVAVMDAAAAAAGSLDPTDLRQALADLAAVRGPVPALIAGPRDRVGALGEEVADLLDVAAPILDAVPTFLGADGPRRYLIGMQNPAELRGTGGLIGFTAELETDDGRMTLSRPQSYSALDALGREADGDLPAVQTPAAFAARYGPHNAAGFLGNVNVDPDLPTTAPVLLDLVEARTGRAFDGLLLVDPLAVAHVLGRIGGVAVDPAVAATAPQLPDVITPDRFAELVMVEHYAAFEGRNEQRRAWLSDVAAAAFTRIFDAEWDGATVTRAVVEAAGSGHLAFHLRDPQQQAAFAAADLVGALRPPDTGDDVLAVTANNAAGNKLDRHVTHRIAGTIDLAGDPASGVMERRAELEVSVTNPVAPGDFSLYVEGSFPPSQGDRTPRSDDRALARTWWSVWAPRLDQVTLGTPHGARTASWVIHDQRVADATVETPSGTAATVTASIRGEVATAESVAGRHYRLHLRRQPKAIADELDLTVRPPEGWRLTGGRVSGGVAAIGVVGDPPGLVVHDGVSARLTGRVTSDVVLELDLARA